MSQGNRGGTRERAGRPRFESEQQKRRNITLSDRLAVKARKIGKGNISEGIRKALAAISLDRLEEIQQHADDTREE